MTVYPAKVCPLVNGIDKSEEVITRESAPR
jgi:hypothetical protein